MNKVYIDKIENCDVSKLYAYIEDYCDGFYRMRIYYDGKLIREDTI